MVTLFIVFSVLVLLGGLIWAGVTWGIKIYNTLISAKNKVIECSAEIGVQEKRRYDLIPNIVETVKGYAKHEKETLENVIKARSGLNTAVTQEDKIEKEGFLKETLKSLFALSEKYPDLKANENFLELQHELTDTENKIQYSRSYYNGNVKDFNTQIERFPVNYFVKYFKFSPFEMLKVSEEERKVVKVTL